MIKKYSKKSEIYFISISPTLTCLKYKHSEKILHMPNFGRNNLHQGGAGGSKNEKEMRL